MAYVDPYKPSTMKRLAQDKAAKDTSKSRSDPPTLAMLDDAATSAAEHPPHTDNKLKDDENPIKPYSIASPRDLDDFANEIRGCFEGKENEQNWDKRRKAIIKASRLTHGNAPDDFRTHYISFIKSHLDGILKVVDSLRTNVSAAGLNHIQHVAIRLGHGVDFMVDFVADTLITRSCNTAKVKRDTAIATFETIIRNATCNKNLLHYIVAASEHKDPNARTAVSTWITALLTKNGRHCDQVGVLDLIDKSIKNGLIDAKPQVRTPMRSTYTTYATIWPERAERLKASLDLKTQKMLDSNTVAEPAKSSLKRPSIRDIKAAKKKEMDAQEIARPESPPLHKLSIKDIKAGKMKVAEAQGGRPTSALSNGPSTKESKAPKKRDVAAENIARPPSAQLTRPLTRETKITKKRVVDGPQVPSNPPLKNPSTHPILKKQSSDPSLQRQPSNPTLKKQDAGVQDAQRPMSAHIPSSLSERRFHILSSAPMRPQRGFVDAKRVPTKPVRTLQQEAVSETSPPPKQSERKYHGHMMKENVATSRTHASQLGHSTAKTVQFETDENDKATSIPTMSGPSTSEPEPTTLVSSARVPVAVSHGVLVDNATKLGKQAKGPKNGPTTVKKSSPPSSRVPIALSVKKRGSTDQRPGSIEGRDQRRLSAAKGHATTDQRRASTTKGRVPSGPKQVSTERRSSADQRSGSADKSRRMTEQRLASTATKGRRPSDPKPVSTERRGSADQRSGSTGQRRPSTSTKGRGSADQRPGSTDKRRGSTDRGRVPTQKRSESTNKRRSSTSTPPTPPTVLREIDQLNEKVEPVKDNNNARRKYISAETAERNRSVSPHGKDLAKARTQFIDAIEKIRAGEMDDYGYRRLQGLIKMHDTLFADEQRYDELLMTLSQALESPNLQRRKMTRPHDNKFQILVTLRLMFIHKRKTFAFLYPKILSALITARRQFDTRCHIVGGLEEIAEEITSACVPAKVIEHVLDVLEAQDYDDAGYRATSMGLQILRNLVARLPGSEMADAALEQRVSSYALRCLRNENSEIRRGTIAFCVELRRVIRPEEKYFKMVANNDEALKSLLTYFITTRRM